MKKALSIIGLITALIATVLSVTKFSSYAVTPIILAFICGLTVVYLSNKDKVKTKHIQYIFLLIIIALSLTIYKSIFKVPEVAPTEQVEGESENGENVKGEKDQNKTNIKENKKIKHDSLTKIPLNDVINHAIDDKEIDEGL